MTGIIPGYWATSGPIHFINQPTRFLCTSGKPGITTHAHTQFHSHINASVLQYFLPSAPSSFLSLTHTHTHTHKLLGYDRVTLTHGHTHWVFPLLFYCLSVMCNQSAAYPCCAVLPSSLKLESESPLCSQPTTKHLPETLVSQPANHTHTHSQSRLHCLSCLLWFYGFGNLAHQTKEASC